MANKECNDCMKKAMKAGLTKEQAESKLACARATNNMKIIISRVSSYYQMNKRLPSNWGDINITSLSNKDEYNYEIILANQFAIIFKAEPLVENASSVHTIMYLLKQPGHPTAHLQQFTQMGVARAVPIYPTIRDYLTTAVNRSAGFRQTC